MSLSDAARIAELEAERSDLCGTLAMMSARIAELEAATSPEATQRHYMRGYNAANARRRRVYVAALEADRDRCSQIIDRLGADNRRLEAEVDRLKAEVAHFQVEYQDEIGRTELIENITTLKAERDRAQADAIAMTSWANALAAERDRLKATLLAVVESISHTDYYPKAWGIARAALSGEGVT
jgi:chromosome segregation ATPase